MASGDSSGGMTTISGLTNETVYTVEVAAVTSAGTGVYSELMQTETPGSKSILVIQHVTLLLYIDVYISLKDEVLLHHSYVVLSNIGSDDSSALLCHTNRPRSDRHSGGDWFSPEGTKVGSVGDVPGFERNRDSMLVRLRRTDSDAANGIYKCKVKDKNETYQTVFVGIYINAEGKYSPIFYYTQVNLYHNIIL